MGNKLTPRYLGPYVIDEVLSKGVYRLRDDKGPLKQTVNACNIKIWNEALTILPCSSPLPAEPESPPSLDIPCTNTPPSMTQAQTSKLTEKDFEDLLRPGEWLNDKHMDAVNALIAHHLGSTEMQSTLICQTQRGFDAVTAEAVQILHDREHWITTGCIAGTVVFMDSLGRPVSDYVKKQMRQLYAHVVSEDGKLQVTVLPCCKQPNFYDCGVYAAANAFLLALGGKADNRVFCNARMRAHLAECLKSNYVTEFPVEDCKRRGRMGKEHVIEI